MRVYLAARFSRKGELNGYAAELAVMGHEMTSRWLTGVHEWTGVADNEIPVDEQQRFAVEDFEDIERADVMVCFTEPPHAGPARGGRHVEAGYALGIHKRLIVVGWRENVFYALPAVEFFPTWEMARNTVFAKGGA